MFQYEKKLQYPVNIKNPNPKYAQIIISQYGGPDGELGASLRYLSQRFSMSYAELKGLLTDIGTEELGHLEMIGAIVYQLTRNLSMEEIKKRFKNAISLVFINKYESQDEAVLKEIKEYASPYELFKLFFNEQNSREINSDEAKYIKSIIESLKEEE